MGTPYLKTCATIFFFFFFFLSFSFFFFFFFFQLGNYLNSNSLTVYFGIYFRKFTIFLRFDCFVFIVVVVMVVVVVVVVVVVLFFVVFCCCFFFLLLLFCFFWVFFFFWGSGEFNISNHVLLEICVPSGNCVTATEIRSKDVTIWQERWILIQCACLQMEYKWLL